MEEYSSTHDPMVNSAALVQPDSLITPNIDKTEENKRKITGPRSQHIRRPVQFT